MSEPTANIALLTKSFAGDFELCRNLCASVDALMPDMTHYLVVERRDRALFAQLQTRSRRIVLTEHYLPEYFRFRRRNGVIRWMTPYRLKPITGWRMQQHAKLAAVAGCSEQAVIMVDSDVEFVRPIDPVTIIQDGRTRFRRAPIRTVRQSDIDWAQNCARLLGAREAAEPAMGYVDNLTVMDARITRMLLQHVARQSRVSWKRAATRMEMLSEYSLYGKFIDYVPGPHQDMIFADSRALCFTLWFDLDRSDPSAEDAFVGKLTNSHVAFGIQSNIGMPDDLRMALAKKLRAAANL